MDEAPGFIPSTTHTHTHTKNKPVMVAHPALESLKQEDHKLKVSLGYIVIQ
jgi:hypothetical protein